MMTSLWRHLVYFVSLEMQISFKLLEGVFMWLTIIQVIKQKASERTQKKLPKKTSKRPCCVHLERYVDP